VRLFASLCNRTEEAPTSLLVVDSPNSIVEPVDVSEPASGALGMSLFRGELLAVFDLGRQDRDEPERSELRAFDTNTLTERWRAGVELARDVHSIAADDDGLLAASSGTDAIVRIDLSEAGGAQAERVVWQASPDSSSDLNHLNTVARVDDRVLVAGFGPRPAPAAWRDAREGFVLELPSERPVLRSIYHPHSICDLGNGEIATCESPLRRVRTDRGRVSENLPGYARGLCIADGSLFVGTSRDRHPGEPLSILPHAGINNDHGIASICGLDLETLALIDVLEISPLGREVFDIIEVSTEAAQ
jgi:hypothetical protein